MMMNLNSIPFSGLAVILVMFATTCLMFLVITTVWNRNVLWAVLFSVGFGSIELTYLSACLAKVPHGGWHKPLS
jgi:KUP system potassium uptake protein